MAEQKQILDTENIDTEINMCKKWERTVYENLMLSRKKKVWWINFPIDLDRKKLTSSDYWPADIKKI